MRNPYYHLPKNFDTMEIGAYYMTGHGEIEKCIAFHPNERIDRQFETNEGAYCPNGDWTTLGSCLVSLTHRVNPDGSLWVPETETKQTNQAMKKIKVKAIFRGCNGSCGYVTNTEYTLSIWHTQCDNVHIQRCSGDGYVAYGSVVALLENWDNIRVL